MVAVHGLYGKSEKTWASDAEDDATGKIWLEDKNFVGNPTARISLFGYDSRNLIASSSARHGIRNEALKLLNTLAKLRDSLDKVSLGALRVKKSGELKKHHQLTLIQEKRCPIVFVAQDLGGIIVKQLSYAIG